MFRTTRTFFFCAWKAVATSWISAFSAGVSSKSPSRLRSVNSPDRRPMVTSAMSSSCDSLAISSAGTGISGSGACGMNAAAGGRFFSCSAM